MSRPPTPAAVVTFLGREFEAVSADYEGIVADERVQPGHLYLLLLGGCAELVLVTEAAVLRGDGSTVRVPVWAHWTLFAIPRAR